MNLFPSRVPLPGLIVFCSHPNILSHTPRCSPLSRAVDALVSIVGYVGTCPKAQVKQDDASDHTEESHEKKSSLPDVFCRSQPHLLTSRLSILKKLQFFFFAWRRIIFDLLLIDQLIRYPLAVPRNVTASCEVWARSPCTPLSREGAQKISSTTQFSLAHLSRILTFLRCLYVKAYTTYVILPQFAQVVARSDKKKRHSVRTCPCGAALSVAVLLFFSSFFFPFYFSPSAASTSLNCTKTQRFAGVLISLNPKKLCPWHSGITSSGKLRNINFHCSILLIVSEEYPSFQTANVIGDLTVSRVG